MSLLNDFFIRRLSMLGLARKYGKTVLQVEAIIRKRVKKGRSGAKRP